MYPLQPYPSSYPPASNPFVRRASAMESAFYPVYGVSPQVVAQGGANFTGWLPNLPLMPQQQAMAYAPTQYWQNPGLRPMDTGETQALPEPEPEPAPLPDKHWTPPQYRDTQDPILLQNDLKAALDSAKKEGEQALPEESKQPKEKVEARNETFDWKEAARHFKDGFISPAISMWQNKKKTLAGVALGGGLLMLTRGLILPVFTALGFAVTGVQLAGGLYKVWKEDNPDLKERAFYNFGAASSTLLLNALTGVSGALKRVLESQDELMEAGHLSAKILNRTAKQVDDMRGLKSPLAVWETFKVAPKCLAESFKRVFSGSTYSHLFEKAKGVTHLHLTIADGIKSTFSQGGIIGSLMMVVKHLANGYEVFSDAHLDLTNLPNLTPQQREYLRKTMAQRAQQLGQLPGINTLSNFNISSLNLPRPTWPRLSQP